MTSIRLRDADILKLTSTVHLVISATLPMEMRNWENQMIQLIQSNTREQTNYSNTSIVAVITPDPNKKQEVEAWWITTEECEVDICIEEVAVEIWAIKTTVVDTITEVVIDNSEIHIRDQEISKLSSANFLNKVSLIFWWIFNFFIYRW